MLVKDLHWQESVDIVVVGLGAAGAIAAITARDLGAEVVVIEKQPQNHHYSNTAISAGTFISTTDVDKVVGYMESISHVENDVFWTDRNIIRTWAEYVYGNKTWAEELGADIRYFGQAGNFPQVAGHECFQVFQFAGAGMGMHNFLTSQVARRGVRVLYGAPAEKLITDSKGKVVGVRCRNIKENRAINIEARNAVIMATGGFEFNETMKLNYLKVYPSYFLGSPANTGDGHRMVMELGADLWHMNCCAARFVAKFVDYPYAFSMEFAGGNSDVRRAMATDRTTINSPAGYIFVDRSGKRFTSENIKAHTLYYELALYDSQRNSYPRIPCFWIFDSRRMNSGPLPLKVLGCAGPAQLYQWKEDNKTELEKGWIVEGGSIEQLAKKLAIPAQELLHTVQSYNDYCKDKNDPEFHRHVSDLVPLDSPPFYAVRLYPGGPNTQGGPRRDHRGRVLAVNGSPIPGLYAAGEFGSIYGMLYPSGGANLGECIAFGRIAAESAIKGNA